MRVERIGDVVRLEMPAEDVPTLTMALLLGASDDDMPSDAADKLIGVWDGLHAVTTYGRENWTAGA